MEIECGNIKVRFLEESLSIQIEAMGERWQWCRDYEPLLLCQEGTVYFKDAIKISHTCVKNGIGQGIESRYQGFLQGGKEVPYTFATYIWVEEALDCLHFEWIPLNEEGLRVKTVMWPGPMEFEEGKASWYTLLNFQQGLLIPNNWPVPLGKIAFDGFFGTAGAYMPWFGQVRERAGYIAICETPWNAGYQAEHPGEGPYTHVSLRLEASLGKMDYKRIVSYRFKKDCDYNELCKEYRAYVKEQGGFCSLAEKAAANSRVDDLIGCAFVHTGIKTLVQPDSDFYDPSQPEKNNHLTTFAQRQRQMERYHELGVEKLYLHLDGWAQPGYDNCHPDYLPACKEAGGWEGMKNLADSLHRMGYLFGIHDQYRDYYFAAPSFDEKYACRLTDGTIPVHKRWAGGPQSYLCATFAPSYVRRNFSEIKARGIRLDGAYLDVFTCNEGDECSAPMHRMTRRECYEYREKCFRYLTAHNILPSSEEVSDWSMKSLVFCHYAPYDFMMRKPDSPKYGIPVPLFNLVYHDCVIIPWMMEKTETEDYMLYALLNGGAPYLFRDGAYPGTDGAFWDGCGEDFKETLLRCRQVTKLHKRVAKCEMLCHELLDKEGKVQRTTFLDGTRVTVDFDNGTYEIFPE